MRWLLPSDACTTSTHVGLAGFHNHQWGWGKSRVARKRCSTYLALFLLLVITPFLIAFAPALIVINWFQPDTCIFNIRKPCLWKKEKVAYTQTSPTKISTDNTWEGNLPMTHNTSQLKLSHKQPTLNTWFPVMYVYHCGLHLTNRNIHQLT